MKAIIKVDAATALREGLNNQGDYTVEFDPADLTPEQRDELASSMKEGGAFQAQKTYHLPDYKLPDVAKADLETLRYLLDARIRLCQEIEAEALAEDTAKFDKFMAKPDEECLFWRTVWGESKLAYYNPFDGSSDFPTKQAERRKRTDVLEKIRRLEAKIPTMKAEKKAELEREAEKAAEIRRKAEEEAARKEAEAKAQQERESAQIQAWVQERGSDNMRGRLAEGLLPKEEVLSAMRDEAFAPLNGFDRYERIKTSDFCNCYGDDPDVSFETRAKKTATAAEFDMLQEIRNLMPDAEVTLKEHRGSCDDCEQELSRTGVHVKLQVGEFVFSREYDVE